MNRATSKNKIYLFRRQNLPFPFKFAILNTMNNLQDNQENGAQKLKPLWWHSIKLPSLNPGSIIEGRVVEKTPKALYLDLGDLGSGVVWGSEFNASSGMIDDLKIDDLVKVKVLSPENEKGFVDLSLQEANRDMGWRAMKDISQKNEIIIGKVLSANRGGLIIQADTFQGFLPTSQMNDIHFPKVQDGDKEKILEELGKLVNKDIEVKVLEFNPRDNKIIFSERKIDDEKMQSLIEEKYKIGDKITATVTKIISNGAIAQVDDQQIRAFIPVSEIDWQPVENPADFIKENESYETQVISLRDGELKLSIKALKQDPWMDKIEKYGEGQIIKGEVYKFMPFGALVKIEPEMYGFIHSSEFGGLDEMKAKLELKKTYNFIIDSIKTKEKRINLKNSSAKE
jgi:small subunit ribosomal protein S1